MSGEKSSSSSSSSSLESKSADKKETKDSKDSSMEDEDDPIISRPISSNSAPPLSMVVVHPLVLLSVVDHYHRVAKDTPRRVVGILLGEVHKGKVDVTNSYAIPFEEDPKDSSAWYLDRQYHEEMGAMFRKVSAKEKVIGWYSTGPKIREVDIEIDEVIRSYCPHPILVIIDVNPLHDPLEIPTQAYVAVEAKPEEKSATRRQFQHLPSEVGAYEAEEVGVEHLLRNIIDTTESSLTDQIKGKLASLKGLKNRLVDINKYVDNVLNGVLPINHQIMYNLQDVLNLMPDLHVPQLQQALSITTNDNSMAIYIASLIRSILSLHDLINNKIVNRQIELDEGKTEEQKKAEKAAREAEAKKKKEEKEKKESEAKKKGGGGD